MFVLVLCSFSFSLVLWTSFFFEVIGELVSGDGSDPSRLMTEPWYQGEGLLLVKLLPALCFCWHQLQTGHRGLGRAGVREEAARAMG